ncbi:DUF6382 domain-containing protein [Caproiciproducens galactitolivorans]|uniref:DUF6382 domain-containing protein n=1 Tax=Caproiciproducens galactitolivorans TaxID=642589 RepID=A0ABT4BSU2_9FIRM|nr:DUF6382 domain-containing protein [Caproiciproducens galactitolivorans]MCY1713971.1 DUF6382 domain-containing protein [Caproiciproducens galactitolivorans]
MNKFKTITRDNQSCFWIKSLKGQQLTMREIEAIKNQEVIGLLPVTVKQKERSFKLGYNITGYIPLSAYLKSPMDKNAFAVLIDNILTILQTLQKSFFNQKCLLLDFKNIMVNPATRRVFFIYVPIQHFDNHKTLKDFFLEIADTVLFLQNEDTGYVEKYKSIINSGVNFSLFELEGYIKELLGQPITIQKKIKCKKCGRENTFGVRFCTSCGEMLIEQNSKEGTVYNPLHFNGAPLSKALAENPDGCENHTDTQSFSEGTSVLGIEEFDGTTVLGDEEQKRTAPYLIRDKTKEKIGIDQPIFKIGKEMHCDYIVSDNNAVSRNHADILTKDGRFYIIDHHSTNKTYVDEKAIPAQEETEIFSGTKLRLGNENFVFYL